MNPFRPPLRAKPERYQGALQERQRPLVYFPALQVLDKRGIIYKFVFKEVEACLCK